MASSEDLNWATKNPQPLCSVVKVSSDEFIQQYKQIFLISLLIYQIGKQQLAQSNNRVLQLFQQIQLKIRDSINRPQQQLYFISVLLFLIKLLHQMCIPEVRPPTQKAHKYVFLLKIICVLQLVISALNLFADSYFVKIGVFGIFLSFCVFLQLRMLYYPLLLLNILLGFYFTCEFLFAFLVFFQNGTNISQASGSKKYTFATIILSLLFYFTTTIFYYYPYIQFKTISYKENPGLARILELQARSESGNIQNEVPYNVNYGQIKVIEGKKNNDEGVFQITKGQGIKI